MVGVASKTTPIIILKNMNDNFETRKFVGANANDVTIVHKEAVLETINQNIVDKDIALDLIIQLEKDAADYITQGKITGVPYIGRVEFKVGSIAIRNHAEELAEAKKHLDQEQFLAFKKDIAVEAIEHAKYESFFRYRASMGIKRNRRTYANLVQDKGEAYAKIKMFTRIVISEDVRYSKDYDRR